MGFFDKFKKKKKEEMPMYAYSEKEMQEFECFIQENFGEFKDVLHEIFSPDVHLDIVMVPPTDDDPYYKMITMGMGAYAMHVPEELKEYNLEHAEMVFYLPKNWSVKSSDEKDYWPIRYMKILGRLPLDMDTWLGYGHTIHGNEDMSPFAENTELNSFVLLPANNLMYEALDLTLSSGKKINFYQMVPLYQEELDYKLENGLESLLSLFDEEDRLAVLDIKRRNYCK
ncbi:MAG: suppressor of fused domain protein [Lachnospiraceae bacterium]|nr:suppressor of fused domain protein [Lachnospiraceae bacterium]